MKKIAYYAKINTPFAYLYLASTPNGLCRVDWVRDDEEKFFSWLHSRFDDFYEDPLLHEPIINQLKQYFDGKLKSFEVTIDLSGTDFQKKVWKALMDIPYGQVCSYKDIAQRVGSPKGFRAVGMANNQNPIAVIIPCHRVIGHDGKLVGYAEGIDIKEKLLVLEGRTIRNKKVVLDSKR